MEQQFPLLFPEVSSSDPITLPTPRTAPPRGRLGRWLFAGGQLDVARSSDTTHPWYRVIWLTGVDYFSDLGFQPGITLIAAGALALPATAFLVAVTLFGAVPLYAQVAKRSYAGQGSIAMLEHLLPGWRGKLFVLALLGFAGTDFLITMTLSAADAARHAAANVYLHSWLGDARVTITLVLLGLLAAVFLMGFREAIAVSIFVAVPYLILNLVVLLAACFRILRHPVLLARWHLQLAGHGNWLHILLVSAVIFPQLALGLGGFETGVSVMPLIQGDPGDAQLAPPPGRVRNTRKLLISAGIIMAVLLLLSSFVCPILIPPSAYAEHGAASGRAISWLAVRLLGSGFATVYDLFSILILWFAGASAMAGLLALIPRYLPRFGMAPRWVAFRRPLVLTLLGLDVVITWIFHASVNAQGSAYATGVLVLMLSAGVAVSLALGKELPAPGQSGRWRGQLQRGYFWLVTLVLAYTLALNVRERPDGVLIASCLILLLLGLSAASRYHRATEMRVSELDFVDPASHQLWNEIAGKKTNLIPSSQTTSESRHALAEKIRAHYKLEEPLTFLHVDLLDNRSEFISPLRMKLRREGRHVLIEASGAVATANSIAYISELLDPVSLVIGLTHKNLMRQSWQYLFWGQGEVGLMVYSILVRYWEWAQSPHRPIIFLMSD